MSWRARMEREEAAVAREHRTGGYRPSRTLVDQFDVNQADLDSYGTALGQECPTCDAQIGWRCRGLGLTWRRAPHASRVQAARRADERLSRSLLRVARRTSGLRSAKAREAA